MENYRRPSGITIRTRRSSGLPGERIFSAPPTDYTYFDKTRNYENSARQMIVENHYRAMRTHQSLAFSKRMTEKYQFDTPRALLTVGEVFTLLEDYVDSRCLICCDVLSCLVPVIKMFALVSFSDPDSSLPNKLHMLQTAEGLRRAGHPDWMQLMGLIHDLGKIMFLWGLPEDGQEGTGMLV